MPKRLPRVSDIALPQFDILNTRAAELRARGCPVISLGQAIPGFGPPESAVTAARIALTASSTHIYSADAGLLSLRAALCDKLEATQGVTASPDDMIITAGGNQAFMLALMTLVDPGDEVLLPAPYFVNHEMAVRAFGARPREVPLDEQHGFELGWDDLARHVSASTRAVVVCTPSNPTGAVIRRDDLARIAGELASRGIVLFVDETYMHFVYDEAGHFSAAALADWRETVVVLGTFSKSFGMTGWRVGFMLADAAVCAQAIKIQDAMIICAPVISQIAVEAAVRQSWDYPLSFRGELIARRRILADGLQPIPRLHWKSTAGGFFAFVGIDGCADSQQLATDILERAHVVTIPGAIFGRSGEGYLRLSYGSATQDELRTALARLADYFASRSI